MLLEVLLAVRAHLLQIYGRLLGGMQFGVLVQVLLWGLTVREHFCIFTVPSP